MSRPRRLRCGNLLASCIISLCLQLLSLPAVHGQSAATCTLGNFCYDATFTIADTVPCSPSYYCEAGRSARLCAKGKYCPTPTQEIECPENHYCPPASVVPRECSPLAACPAGSFRYVHWGCLLLLVILLPLIFAAPWIYKWYNAKMRAKLTPKPAVVTDEGGEPVPSPANETANLDQVKRVPNMEILFQNLKASVDVNGMEKVILEDVSGHFKAGRLIACMGPSGAGKSSLISVLTGKIHLKSGSIETRIEGCLEEDLRQARRLGMIGVVPQADIMIPSLNARDILTHSAFTRLPATWSAEQKVDRVNQTLKALNLERCQFTPVGDEHRRGVSGGEKKRVNIGIELVNSPSLLVLDEPTTGLDATSSVALVHTLKGITRQQGTTVVAVLHQPRNEIFRSLDDLLLLAPGGRTVYFGPAELAQSYFESIGYICDAKTNVSDFFIDVIAGKAGPPRAFAAKAAAIVIQSQLPAANVENDNAVREFSPAASPKMEVKSLRTDEATTTSATSPSRPTTVSTPADIQRYLAAQWKGEPGESFARNHGLVPAGVDSIHNAQNANKVFQSDVQLPSLGQLVALYTYRGFLQMVRDLSVIQLEALMHILAGLVIGMAFVEDNWFILPVAPEYIPYCPDPLKLSCAQDAIRDVVNLMATFTVMAVGLVSTIIGNRCYGHELLNMHREASSGISSTAYMLGKALSELPLIVVYSFLYCVSYFLVASPNANFNKFYTAILLFEFTMFGAGYVASLLLHGENALLLSAIGALLGGLATDNSSFEKNICWARWVSEALFVAEARVDLLPPPLDTYTQLYFDGRNKFKINNYSIDIVVLFFYGLFLRLVAYLLIHRKFKQ